MPFTIHLALKYAGQQILVVSVKMFIYLYHATLVHSGTQVLVGLVAGGDPRRPDFKFRRPSLLLVFALLERIPNVGERKFCTAG